MIRVRQIVECRQIDRENTHRRAPQSQYWDNPWNRWVRRPAEPEQPHWHEDRLDTRKVQAAFGAAGKFAHARGGFFLVDAEERGQEGADGDGGEHSANLLDVEAVVR